VCPQINHHEPLPAAKIEPNSIGAWRVRGSGLFSETVATLLAGWDSAHAIRLGNKPFAELGANSEALSGSQVDSPCSLPSDPRIGPGNVAIVSKMRGFGESDVRRKAEETRHGGGRKCGELADWDSRHRRRRP